MEIAIKIYAALIASQRNEIRKGVVDWEGLDSDCCMTCST